MQFYYEICGHGREENSLILEFPAKQYITATDRQVQRVMPFVCGHLREIGEFHAPDTPWNCWFQLGNHKPGELLAWFPLTVLLMTVISQKKNNKLIKECIHQEESDIKPKSCPISEHSPNLVRWIIFFDIWQIAAFRLGSLCHTLALSLSLSLVNGWDEKVMARHRRRHIMEKINRKTIIIIIICKI
jgi:hypothetical protein